MIEVEINEYKKPYVELSEIIKRMSKEEKEKIPQSFIKNLEKDKDKEYKYVYDETKGLQEQKIKVETKALLVQLYEQYLVKPEEKDFWCQYNKQCFKIEEAKKTNDYNNLFNKKKNNN